MKNSMLLLLLVFTCRTLLAQTITIDHQLPTSPPFPQYQPGIFSVPKTANGMNDLLNNGIHFNAIRTIDIEEAMNHWTVSDISGVMARLEVQKNNILLADSRSDLLVIPILKMPLWLSSSSDATEVAPGFNYYNAVPPANYTTWNILMDSIVDKINNQWGLDVYYEIWNEPDGDYWQGTEQEYFTFFKNTLQAIKSNHPNAKVGGPVVSNFVSSFSASFPNGYLTNAQLDATILGQVIDSCVAWGTPLDFVSWHKFGVNLYSEDNQLDYLNQKLVNSGHGLVPFVVSEWNLGFGFRETILDPAYMINYTQSCAEHGVTGHMVAAWQDFEQGTDEFHGDYGLLSWGALHKPSWKALQLLNKMTGQLLDVDVTSYRNLNTIASYENDTLRVLVSNYSLPGSVEAGLSLFFDHQLSSDSLMNNGYLPSTIDSIFQGLIILSGTDPLSLAINSEITTYQAAESYFQNGRDITLKFPGIIGNHTGKITFIDSTRNNVIHAYDSLINIGYTRTNAVNYLYPNDNFDSGSISMIDSTFNFHLDANGVALIELYLPEITVSTSEIPMYSPFEVYPNPTNDIVYIGLPEKDLISVLLVNSQGKHLGTYVTPEFSMKSLPNG
ncbi:MAG: hypothetical protein EP305_11805, partial [Bacteroidetes bacterium]